MTGPLHLLCRCFISEEMVGAHMEASKLHPFLMERGLSMEHENPKHHTKPELDLSRKGANEFISKSKVGLTDTDSPAAPPPF